MQVEWERGDKRMIDSCTKTSTRRLKECLVNAKCKCGAGAGPSALPTSPSPLPLLIYSAFVCCECVSESSGGE